MNFFGNNTQPSGPSPLALAKIEAEIVGDMFGKLSASCFKKCVVKHGEADLQVGEMTCIDRCVGKYMEAGELVEKQLKTFEEQMKNQERALAEANAKLGVK